jgi:CHAD domain-containing protein
MARPTQEQLTGFRQARASRRSPSPFPLPSSRRAKPFVAAAVAVGVGVAAAVAKAELERRSARKGPDVSRSKLKRLTLEQLDLAIALLQGCSEVSPERTVHETRKALKRARALVRLQQSALGRRRFRRVNATLRQAGRQLAGARDAEVILDTLETLLKGHPKRLAHSAGVVSLRALLLDERERSQAHTRPGANIRGVVLEELRATRLRLERWEPAQSEGKTARLGLHHIYRQGRLRGRRARKAGSSPALHAWRKRVKDLRYAAEALELRKVAKRADRLGETIGEEHDLWLLSQRLRRHRKCFKGDRAARKQLRKLIAQRRQRLRKRAFKLGRELYRQPPKRFVRRRLTR